MEFTKLDAFSKKVTDLIDNPSENLSPTDIKAYFDTPDEELKDSHNNLVDGLNSDGWVDQNKLAPNSVVKGKVAPGSIGTSEIDPNIINQPNTLIGAQAQLQQVNEQLAETSTKLQSLDNYTGGGIVTFIDDDSQDTFFTRWKPLADTLGIKISEAVNTSQVGTTGHMTLAQLQQLKSEGYDLLSHGYTHPNLDTMSIADIDNEWNLSKQYLIDNGLGDGLALVYPTGLYSITDTNKVLQVKTVTRKYYRYGIDANSGTEAFANVLPVDSFEVNRVLTYPATVTLAAVKGFIDDAYANGKWLIFLTHCGASWDDTNSPTNLTDIVNYINSLSMPILNFREAEKLVGNTISHGDSRTPNYHFVSKNGATFDSSVGKTMARISKSMDEPITSFAYDRITTFGISGANDAFLGVGGLMRVYRGAKYYSHALYFPVQKNEIYKRFWDENLNAWSSWKEINISEQEILTGGLMSTPITSYEQRRLSITEVHYSQDTLLSVGGLLITARGGDDAYAYQNYIPSTKTSLYTRKWNKGSSVWLSWIKLSSGEYATTATRPTNLTVGAMIFDTTLNKPIWLKQTPSTWVDATGAVV